MLGRSDYEVVLLHVIREVNSYSWLHEGIAFIPSKLKGSADAIIYWKGTRIEMGARRVDRNGY